MEAYSTSQPSTVAPSTVSAPSANLGKYRLIVRLAQGGMGDVYLAVHQGPAGFHKLAVIKELRSMFAEDGTSLRMFLDEARLAARLSHQNVVQTNEVSCEGSRHFMVMEYLDGKPFHHMLRNLIPTRKFAWPLRVHVLCEALKGLHYAHELKDFDGTPLNVVHRDFTPHNIFVTYEGVVKVLDFGIAKAVDSQETRTGVIKGKAAYMPPEQAMGKTIDRRADIYAAGVMLWECLTGRRMWPNLSEMQILMQILQQAPPVSPREVNPQLPEEISSICMRALSQNAEDRYETAEQMRLEIENFLDSKNLRAKPSEVGELLAEAFHEERQRVQAVVETAVREMRLALDGPNDIRGSTEVITHSSIRPSIGLVPGMAQVRDLAPPTPSSPTSSTVISPALPSPEPSELPAGLKPRLGRRIGLAVLAVALVSVAYLGYSRIRAASRLATVPATAKAAMLPAVAKAEAPKLPTQIAAPSTAEAASSAAAPVAKTESRPAESPRSQAQATARSEALHRSAATTRPSSSEESNKDTQAQSHAAFTPTPTTAPTPQPAPAPTVMAFSGEMTRPMMLSGRDPVYTREAREAKVEGTAVAKCTITTQGRVTNCRVVKSLPFMEKSVLDALYSRRYTPVLWEGKPVAVSYVFNIRVVRPQ